MTFALDHHISSAQQTDHGVCLTATTTDGVNVITVSGELDANNMAHLSDYVGEQLTAASAMILDLSGLDFLAAEGIRALLGLNNECAVNDIDWAIVPNHQVNRLLEICDKGHALPTTSSVDEALERFSAQPRSGGLLQLVPQPR